MQNAKTRKYRGGGTANHFARWAKAQPVKQRFCVDGVWYVRTFVGKRVVSVRPEILQVGQ